MTVQSQAGKSYLLEYVNDLSTVNWMDIQPVVPGTGGPITLTDTNATANARFYRVRVE